MVLACVSGCLSCNRHHPQQLDLPRVMLWAWERPENLGFIDPRVAGVAVLEATAVIARSGSVSLRMRTQALTLPTSAAVLAVVRIESPPEHAAAQMAPLLSGLLAIAQLPGIRGIQIDFDARSSERVFYRKVLRALAEQTSLPISVTALASWCAGDRWLDGEPIVDAVPMFFRMGVSESREMQVRSPVCRASIGLSTDEPWPSPPPDGIKRIYIFTPRAWTPETYNRAMLQVLGWR